mmetsp:Transcript_13001/g.20025  ORF Transcript_13001/g.20025 Transcript_13001/m.20025 type:complete len:200 (+) Transcript_13001:1571-2170(+)
MLRETQGARHQRLLIFCWLMDLGRHLSICKIFWRRKRSAPQFCELPQLLNQMRGSRCSQENRKMLSLKTSKSLHLFLSLQITRWMILLSLNFVFLSFLLSISVPLYLCLYLCLCNLCLYLYFCLYLFYLCRLDPSLDLCHFFHLYLSNRSSCLFCHGHDHDHDHAPPHDHDNLFHFVCHLYLHLFEMWLGLSHLSPNGP